MPLIAVLIALAIAWQSYSNRGTIIAVAFPDASGVTAGETTLRYREVVVGVVEEVGFSSDLASVNVYIRVSPDIAPFLDEDAAFWVVQPTVSARGVEGLNTILSGTYIEGTWDSEIGTQQTLFQGDDRAPIVPPGIEGTAIVLRASDGARLEAGAPILYRGIEVGELATPRLSSDGSEVRIDAFVRAPYDRQLSTATRFWDSSGISVSLGGSGVELNVGSLAAILEGGVVFDTLISGGEPVTGGEVFDIYEDRDDALASTFEAPTARAVRFAALFPTAASGLTEGAVVRYRGVSVGVVTSITGFVRPDAVDGQVELLAGLALQPRRMGLDLLESDLDGIDYVDGLVERGLRAQLVSTSLFGGDLAVELVDTEGLLDAGLEFGIADNPLIPTIEGDTSSLTASAEGVMTRINELPIEELLLSATDLLDNLNRIAGDPDTRAIPGAALATIEGGEGLVRDVRAIVSSPDTAAVLLDVRTIADDVAALTAQIREAEVAAALAATLDGAEAALANVTAGTENLDALSASALVLFDEAGRLIGSEGAQALPGAATEALEAGRAVLADPAIAAILDDAAAVTADMRTLAAGIATEETVARIDAALASVDAAARNVAEGTADLATLRTAIDGAVAGARDILASPDTLAIPAAARAALEAGADTLSDPSIRAILGNAAAITADLRRAAAQIGTEEAVARIGATIESVETAAAGLAAGTADLETLRAALDDAAAGAADLLSSPDLQALPASVRGVADDARAILGAPEIEALLRDLPLITASIREITDSLAAAEAGQALTDALIAAEEAALAVADSTGQLPEITASVGRVTAQAEVLAADLTRLVGKANDLALDELVDATTELMVTADAFLSSDEAGDVPVVLSNTLEELRLTIETIRTGGTLDNLNATLVSAAGAADAARVAAADLPALVNRLQTLSVTASGVLGAYGEDSRIAQELAATLRAATRAAEDVSSLSRTIERNPNSLLLGR